MVGLKAGWVHAVAACAALTRHRARWPASAAQTGSEAVEKDEAHLVVDRDLAKQSRAESDAREKADAVHRGGVVGGREWTARQSSNG